MTSEQFGTVFNCMDGRCQKQAVGALQDRYGSLFPDTITEPGLDGILAGKREEVLKELPPNIVAWLREKASISARGHGSKVAIVLGHLSCAGNPCTQDEASDHVNNIKTAVAAVQSWELFEEVKGLLVNERWEVRWLDGYQPTKTVKPIAAAA